MAESWRALRTLKALQAEQAVLLEQTAGAAALEVAAEKLLARVPGRTDDRPRVPARAAAERLHARAARAALPVRRAERT